MRATDGDLARTSRKQKSERQSETGPDQLPNDFYLDNIDLLVAPWVTGEYPDGHREATIFAVPKGQTSDDPIRYQPMAMLNSDYKILAKVLATRLRSVVHRLVHNDQHAFVPERTIHEAIDVFTACSSVGHNQTDGYDPPAALILDVAKAYDSMERDFISAVLREMRLPERLLQFIQQTHQDTTARFLVNNGELFRAVPVTRGHSPRVPSGTNVVLLGLEPLIHRVTTHPELDELQVLDEHKMVSLVAYTENTTVYLASSSELGEVRLLLYEFAVHSGLQINVTKSLVVPLIRD